MESMEKYYSFAACVYRSKWFFKRAIFNFVPCYFHPSIDDEMMEKKIPSFSRESEEKLFGSMIDTSIVIEYYYLRSIDNKCTFVRRNE